MPLIWQNVQCDGNGQLQALDFEVVHLGYREGFSIQTASWVCGLALGRPALETFPRWKPRGTGMMTMGKCAAACSGNGNRTLIWVAMAMTAGGAVVRDHDICASSVPLTYCLRAGWISAQMRLAPRSAWRS